MGHYPYRSYSLIDVGELEPESCPQVREASIIHELIIMQLLRQSVFLVVLLSLSFATHAELPNFKAGQPYQEVKAELIKQGWKPVKNTKISNSSLYAQEVYQQGMEEVVDCVSMELDACWFRYKKSKERLEVKTITGALKFDSLKPN
jgi:hypothetical protein